MLFSGGTAAKPKKDERKEKKIDRDEKYDIQELVFVRWGNSLLANEPLKEFRDLADLKYISSITHIASGCAVSTTGNKLDDCQAILTALGDVKTVASDLAEGQQKAVLTTWWNLVQAFWRRLGPEPLRNDKLSEAIKHWCLEVTADYEQVQVNDFVSSWRDGYAFNCLLHNFDRKLVSMRKLTEMTASERLENAFSIADKELRASRLLTVKDLQSEHLDSHSVVTYLMTLYLSLVSHSTMSSAVPQRQTPSMDAPSSPTTPSSVAAATPVRPQSLDFTEPSTSSAHPLPPPLPPAVQQRPEELERERAPPPSPQKQQSVDQPSEEVRSRKSSSSSQKSGKSKRERKEAMTREFENCLEDVLSWLLEAEEELSLLSPVEDKDVAIVRKQFKEFEQFMCSLTDSQETVGKVLHRGQILSAKTDSEEEKEAILAQLRIVNQRWEELRAMALHRQTKLQTQLNQLQNKQLSLITRWLTQIEQRVADTEPVATGRNRILEQIEEHTNLQNEIEEFQPNILALNSFVAVVDDGESAAESVSSLEKSMREIGDRWQTLCGWAETRSSQLDGLADIVAETSEVYDRLNSWLKDREHDLLGLKSAHHLEEQDQVAEQVRKLQAAEAALEAEHSQFVKLSQLSCELVARLDTGNGAEANEVRRRLDTITQRWDNLVARIEEHSKTLVRSGKADLRQLRQPSREHATSTDAERSSPTIDEAVRQDRVLVIPKDDNSRVDVTTLAAVEATTTDTDNEEMGNQLVERFLRHVARLSQEMEPLRQWMDGFSVSKRPDQLRRMIAVCQEKLVEIKDQEAKVTRLQLELEHLHSSPFLNAKQLKTANDAFDKFAKGWAVIVTKISEAMNHLTGHDDSEEGAVAHAIEQWIEGCDRVLTALPKVTPTERGKRLDRLEEQAKTQASNLEFVQKDAARKAILKKGLAIVQKRIDAARGELPEISTGQEEVEKELDGEWSSVGDPETLDKDLKRSEVLVDKARSNRMNSEIIERSETRRAEMEERRRATAAATDKVALAEGTLVRIRDKVAALSKSEAELGPIVAGLKEARDEMAKNEVQRKEAERATEKMLALDDNVPSMVVARARERVRELMENWKKLNETIEDHVSCAQKEHKRQIQKTISDEERLLEKLEKTLVASESAADAEECCEHLDNLENLLEKVASSEQIPTSAMEESFVRDTYARLSDTKEKISERARKRVDELTKAVEECEQFERQIASMQQWASTMYPLLTSRIATDVSALDVPEEYQMISSEFDEWNKVLEGLEKWLNEGERKSNERSWAQLKHSQNTYTDLLKKFNEFKKPKGFEERLERAKQRLADVEIALDDLTGIEGSDCEKALEEAKAQSRRLDGLQKELEDLTKGENQLTEGGMIDTATASNLRQKILESSRKTKELGARAESAVDRLEDCVSLYTRLEKKAREVEKYLEDSETALDKFVQEDKASDDGEVSSLIAEWNRRETDLRDLEDAERVLRERAVRVDDRLSMDLRRRAEMLKQRLDNWSRTLENMEADEEEQLLQLDEMHHDLLSKLRDSANKPPSQIAETLRFLRGDRDRLSSRARRLAARNPRLAGVNMISEVTKEWDDLEKKLHVPEEGSQPRIETATLEEGLAFPEQVEKLHEHFAKADTLLDFDTNPISSAGQWHQRVEALDEFLASSRPALDALVEAGRDLATKGRLELSTHTAIDRLDELCDVVDVLETKLEEQREKVAPLLARAESLARDAAVLEGVVDQLSSRDLQDEQVAKATRRDLAERDNQLNQLGQRAGAIHAGLPGASSQSRDTSLVALSEKLSALESKLAEKKEKSLSQPRTTPESRSSAGPLAMEAYGTTTDAQTQDEEDRPPVEKKKKIILPGEGSGEEEPPIQKVIQEDVMMEAHEEADMDKVFEELACLEDRMLEEEQFPMEGIERAEERYNDYENRLLKAEKIVMDNQMTLDMLQTEACMERSLNLKKELSERRQKLHPLKQEWAEFISSLEQTEAILNVPERKREPSPALEELEQDLMNREQRHSRAEQHVCDVIRRLGLILPRMNENSPKSTAIRNRVRDLEDRFKDASSRIQEEKIRLETRAISQLDLSKQLEELVFWCDEAHAELGTNPNPLDPVTTEQAVEAIKKKVNEVETKKSLLSQLEISKERLLALDSMPQEAKHHIRRAVADVAKRMADLRSDLFDRKLQLEKEKELCDTFWTKVESMAGRATDLCRRSAAVNSAQLFTPSGDHITSCRAEALQLEKDVSSIKDRIQQAGREHDKLSTAPEKRLLEVLVSCEAAVAVTATLPEPSKASTSQGGESMLSSQATSQATIIPSTRLSDSSRGSPASEVEEDDTVEGEEEIEEPEQAGSLPSSRHSAISEVPSATAHLSPRDASNWNALTQLRHWLTENERDAGVTVDISDHVAIRNLATTVQGIADQVRLKLMDVVGLQDSSAAVEVKQKSRDLGVEMDRVAKQCERRRAQLAMMGEASRTVETARANMELWLENVEITLAEKRGEETTEEVRRELDAVNEIVAELDVRKDAMADLNAKGNALLDEYNKDEAHQLSHLLSRVNMRWTRCNDNVRIRRAALEARLRSRNDFHSALDEFEEWLNTTGEEISDLEDASNNTQAIKDSQKRREWNQQHKGFHAAIDAHTSVYNAVEEMGRKMGAGLEVGREKTELLQRMDHMAERWNTIRAADEAIKIRLENAEQEWEKLTHNLSSHLSWIETKTKETLGQQPVGGSLSSVMSQGAWVKNVEREMEARGPAVRETIAAAHSYLMQHDLRPKMHKPGVLSEEPADNKDSEQRRCGLQIFTNVEQLKENWAELGKQLAEWHQTVQAAAQRHQELEGALAECQLHLSALETEMEKLVPVEEIKLEELKTARGDSEALGARLDSVRVHVDDTNEACGKILAADQPLDPHPRNQRDDVNRRFAALRTKLRSRVAALKNALSDFGPSSEHFLNQSVTTPWQRAISKTNQLPYYIDHTTEKTQWEHPVWVEMSKELSQFNRVKFIAYRTAMKLRALQKRLCLDLVELPLLEKCFGRLAGLSNEESPALEGMVCTLLPLFEELHRKHPQQVRNVALAVDLCINFLLNLFDPTRDGTLRVLSFKIAMVAFCNAPLEEKYRYLFALVAQDDQASQKQIALLLYDLIHIPRLVGEAAAFGGANVEPSVRSCFETVRLSPSIAVQPFLDWVKREPQSIVWLPVMHRLAAAEFAKHSAKCNVCKMFPIVGLRYRCLRCFNVDLCQNCFFSQRTAKSHKLKHPMQEYAQPTTSAEDARDFATMVRNKFGRCRRNLGYLPVDVADEGKPLAAPPQLARNPETDALHQRTSALASRLAVLTASQPAEPRDEVAEVKSPAQLMNQVDQMHKDELDQLLQRLQLENLELKHELEKRKTAAASTPHLDRTGYISPEGYGHPRRSEQRGGTLPRLSNASHGKSAPSLKSSQSQGDVMDEARALRLHKQRLEHRSRILEQQNEQLEMQLQRLKKMIDQQKGENSSRFDSASADREWMDPLAAASPQSQQPPPLDWAAENGDRRQTRMHSLLATVDDLGRAMENLVVSVVYDSDPEE